MTYFDAALISENIAACFANLAKARRNMGRAAVKQCVLIDRNIGQQRAFAIRYRKRPMASDPPVEDCDVPRRYVKNMKREYESFKAPNELVILSMFRV